MSIDLEKLIKCEVCDEWTHPRADGSPRCPLHLPEVPEQAHSGKASGAPSKKKGKTNA